ncbi:MAG: M48 family metallopeptidase [Thiohalobacterales bacterium]
MSVHSYLSILLFSLLITSCATSPTGRSQLVLIPESEINQMGRQAFTNLKEETPVNQQTTTNNYVQCVADAITRETGGSWEVVVFKDDAANAFALPGGKIGVYTGLLEVAENQHQLATVIGHEVAHVQARHANERVSQSLAVEQGLNVISAIASPQSGAGQSMMGMLGVGAQYGILMPYSRIQESEADMYGLDLMARAGFDPRESVQLWKNMARKGGDQPPEFLSTHPSHNTRINDLVARLPLTLRLMNQAQQRGRRPDCGKL